MFGKAEGIAPRKLLILIAAAASLIGCATTDEQADAIRASSLKSNVCVIHKCSLQSTKAYRFTAHLIVDPTEAFLQLDRDYPNAIVFPFAAKKSGYFTKPDHYKFCPECEKKWRARAEILLRQNG
jgi:hypothetical protein